MIAEKQAEERAAAGHAWLRMRDQRYAAALMRRMEKTYMANRIQRWAHDVGLRRRWQVNLYLGDSEMASNFLAPDSFEEMKAFGWLKNASA